MVSERDAKEWLHKHVNQALSSIENLNGKHRPVCMVTGESSGHAAVEACLIHSWSVDTGLHFTRRICVHAQSEGATTEYT